MGLLRLWGRWLGANLGKGGEGIYGDRMVGEGGGGGVV